MAPKTLQFIISASDKFTGTLGKLHTGLGNLENKTSGFRKGISSVGGALAGIGAGVGIASLWETASKYEDVMDKLRVNTSATNDEFVKLENMSKSCSNLGFGDKKVAETMGSLSDMNLSASEILQTTPQFIKFLKAGHMEIQDGAELTDDLINGYKVKIDKLGQAYNSLFVTSKETGQGFGKIKGAVADFAPIAGDFNMSLENVLATVAQFHKGGIGTDKGLSALARGLAAIQEPSAAAIKSMRKLGIQKTDFFDKNGDFLGMANMARVFQKSSAEKSDYINIFEKKQGLLLGSFLKTADPSYMSKFEADLPSGRDLVSDQVNAATDNKVGKMARLGASWERFSISLSTSGMLTPITAAIDAGTHLMTVIGDLAERFPKLTASVGLTGGALVGIVTFLGPITKVVGNVKTLTTMIKGLELAVKLARFASLFAWVPEAAASLGGLALALGAALLPIAAVGAVIYTVYQVWKNWDDIILGTKQLLKEFNEENSAHPGYEMSADEIRQRKEWKEHPERHWQPNFDRNDYVTPLTSTEVKKQEAAITISFKDLPKGTRVTPSGNVPMTLDLGFAGGY